MVHVDYEDGFNANVPFSEVPQLMLPKGTPDPQPSDDQGASSVHAPPYVMLTPGVAKYGVAWPPPSISIRAIIETRWLLRAACATLRRNAQHESGSQAR